MYTRRSEPKPHPFIVRLAIVLAVIASFIVTTAGLIEAEAPLDVRMASLLILPFFLFSVYVIIGILIFVIQSAFFYVKDGNTKAMNRDK